MPILMTLIVPHPPLIIPEIGRGEQQKIQNTVDAYEKAAKMVADAKPETIVVISPHSIMYSDYIHISPGASAKGGFVRFGAPGVSISKDYDSEFVDKLSEFAEIGQLPAGTLGQKDPSLDHGTLVPLYFIDKYINDYKLVRISISGLSFLEHYQFGKCIARAAQELGRNITIVASGDLSHKLMENGPYGYAEEGPEFDRLVTHAMKTAKFMEFLQFDDVMTEAAAECGLRSFIEMAGALDGKSVDANFMSYEGPFGVGYAVCTYNVTGDDENRRFGQMYEALQKQSIDNARQLEDEYIKLARQSLETYLSTGHKLEMPEGLPKEMLENRAGVFVSLKKHGKLRGCIGTLGPTATNIAQEIIQNAVSSGTADSRFSPVTESELVALEYSVDILSEAEPIDSIEQLDACKFGVIVSKGGRRGLLLPNLEGVDMPEQQISIALQKAGISPSENYSMERFEVVRHK